MSPFINSLEQALFAVHTGVHISRSRIRSEASWIVLGAQLGGVLHEEATSDRGVCVETDLELVEEREEVFFNVSGHSIVVSLEDGREHRASGGLDVVDLLHVGGSEIGEAELLRD